MKTITQDFLKEVMEYSSDTGVFLRRKWRARVGTKNLGYFWTKEEARDVARKAAEEMYGEFAGTA